MTTAAVVRSDVQKIPFVNLWTWAALTGAIVGDPIQQPGQKGVLHLTGTFGATIVLEGSNDGVTYVTLKDKNGNAMSYTAAAVVETQALPAYVRINAGAVTSVVAALLTYNK